MAFSLKKPSLAAFGEFLIMFVIVMIILRVFPQVALWNKIPVFKSPTTPTAGS